MTPDVKTGHLRDPRPLGRTAWFPASGQRITFILEFLVRLKLSLN